MLVSAHDNCSSLGLHFSVAFRAHDSASIDQLKYFIVDAALGRFLRTHPSTVVGLPLMSLSSVTVLMQNTPNVSYNLPSNKGTDYSIALTYPLSDHTFLLMSRLARVVVPGTRLLPLIRFIACSLLLR